ncbi:MAG: hypothetical protein ACR2N7_08940 [Acidimicrobiia bacterium]
MRDWVRNLMSPGVRERVSGAPSSGNGASSFHLWWDVPYGERLTAASVTLDVARRPDLDRLVFFALQVAFVKPGGGAAHLGLQHHPAFPGQSAVNWGGYDADGTILEGSTSALASARDDRNTRDFRWESGRPYQLTVERGESAENGKVAWIGSVTDLVSGDQTTVRELFNPGQSLRAPVVWVESFAPCDAPRFEARWSNATVITESGDVRAIKKMRADYQPHAAGGCTNTNSIVDGVSFVQRTGQLRTTNPGTTLAIG